MQTKIPALQPPDPTLRIRPVQQSDLEPLLRTAWADRSRDVGRWLMSRVLRNRQDGRGTAVVALDAGSRIIGYGQFTRWPRCAEISDLFVLEQHRSQGYGTAIIQTLMHEAARLGASCVEIGAAQSNVGAVRLYHRLGFEDHREITMNTGDARRERVIYMKIVLPQTG